MKKEKEMKTDCKECVKLREQIKQLIYINQCKSIDIEELKLEVENEKAISKSLMDIF